MQDSEGSILVFWLDSVYWKVTLLINNHMYIWFSFVSQFMYPPHAYIPHQHTITHIQSGFSDTPVKPDFVTFSCFGSMFHCYLITFLKTDFQIMDILGVSFW